ncbi:hypothetical protein FHR88_007053 [Bradyrhizobium betae]|nr:hypothetical protein [Bradyrhizobium betae]
MAKRLTSKTVAEGPPTAGVSKDAPRGDSFNSDRSRKRGQVMR